MSRARHHEKHHSKHHKDEGGRIGMKASGNPDVFKEAEDKESYAKGDERKHGGKVHKKKHHGMHAEGKMAKHRRDKPMHHAHGGHAHHMHKGRKSGGRVGSDKSPLSSAHHSGAAGDMAHGEPD